MHRRGLLAHEQRLADRAVRAPLGHEQQHLELARREAEASGRRVVGLGRARVGSGVAQVDAGAAGERGDVLADQRRAGPLRRRGGRPQRRRRGGAVAGRHVRLAGAEARIGGGKRQRDRVERARDLLPRAGVGRGVTQQRAAARQLGRRHAAPGARLVVAGAGRALAQLGGHVVERRLVGLAERMGAAGRVGLDALRHPAHAQQPRRLVGMEDPRRGAQQDRARVVRPVPPHGQLDLDLRARLDPLRLGRSFAQAPQLGELRPRRGEVAAEQRQPGAHVAPVDAGVGDRLARDPCGQLLARLGEPPEPGQQVRLLDVEERVEGGALRAHAGHGDLLAREGEPLLGAAGEVQQLRQVGGRAAAVGGRGDRACAGVPLAHRGDPLRLVAEPGAREPERDQRPHLGQLRTDGARLLERLRHRGQGLLVVAHQHLQPRALLEHARALRARARRQQLDRAIERVEAVPAGAGLPQRVAEPQVERGGAQRLGLRVEGCERLTDQRDRPRRLSARHRARGGVAQHLGAVHPGALLRVGHARPQLERALEVAAGLLVGVQALGRDPRPHARPERAAELVGGAPVARELRRDRRLGHVAEQIRALLERLGDPAVQRRVLAWEQVVVDRLADERVAEAVHPVGADHEHLVGDRLARALHHLGGGEPGDGLEQPVRDRPVEHGGRAHHRLGGGSEALDAREQDVAQRLGQLPAVAVLGRRQQLLREQRVALRAAEEPLGQRGRRGLLHDALELFRQLAEVEAVEREPVDARGALELGQQRAQGMAPVQLVGAIGDDEAERLLARAAHEEGDEVARRAVGPVQVLDREQHRAGAPETLEQREQRLEQPALAGAGLLVGARPGPAELRQQLRERVARRRGQGFGPLCALGGEAAGERPQRGDQRCVRDLRAAELEALPEQHARPAGTRAGLDLAQQPRLADARLAPDEDERGPARRGALERGAQQCRARRRGRRTWRS